MFFINNPWTLVISIIIIIFLVLMGIKIASEINLNSLLKQRHSFMRIETGKPNIGFGKRIGILTSTALAPIAVVAIVVIIGGNVTSTPSGEMRSFNDSNDIEGLYQKVSDYLPSNDALDYESLPGDSSHEINFDAELDDITYSLVDDLYNVVTSITTSGEVYGSDEFTKSVNNEDYYYSALENSVEVTINNNEGATKDGTQFVDSIVYVGTSGSCTNGYLVKALDISEDYLTVVALEYPSECLGVKVDDNYLYDNLNVLVSVFDVDDLEDVTNYRLSGNLTGINIVGDNIYVTTKRYLDYEVEGFDISSYLPFYKIDGVRKSKTYEEIIYVEGTTPDSYTNIYGINIVDKKVDMETILVGYNNDIYLSEKEIQVVGTVYYLNPLAGMFELDAPLDDIKEITYRFVLSGGKIDYEGNEIK